MRCGKTFSLSALWTIFLILSNSKREFFYYLKEKKNWCVFAFLAMPTEETMLYQKVHFIINAVNSLLNPRAFASFLFQSWLPSQPSDFKCRANGPISAFCTVSRKMQLNRTWNFYPKLQNAARQLWIYN